jgi:predicted TIM-barrel fold metal-dependent hydrolase
MRIDAHHHLWDLGAVRYPWLMAAAWRGSSATRRRSSATTWSTSSARDAAGFGASVHIQVGAADGWAEAAGCTRWPMPIPDWPMAQVVFCDLTAPDLADRLDRFVALPTRARRAPDRRPRAGRGRADRHQCAAGRSALCRRAARRPARGLSFDLQLIPS